ncbi:MAG: SDR family NAD(P)-dependent oxidoreductase [Pseudomonadota bacterium]
MFDLTGHVAVVTGGNGGLGLAYARGLVKAGASVAVWGRNGDKNAAALAELRDMGGDADAFACDVVDENQVATAFENTLSRFGRIDSCFANAGGPGFRAPSHETDRDTWLAAIDLNLMSVVQTWKPVIGHFLKTQRRGKLVVTSSVAAIIGMGGASGYSTTKAAVTGYVRALAVELGASGITVNAILPGYIETDLSRQLSDEFVAAIRRRSAIGRLGQLEDVEGIAVYLASRHSEFMTGQSLVLDGGHTIHPA